MVQKKKLKVGPGKGKNVRHRGRTTICIPLIVYFSVCFDFISPLSIMKYVILYNKSQGQ